MIWFWGENNSSGNDFSGPGRVPDDHFGDWFFKKSLPARMKATEPNNQQKRKANLSISTKKLDYWLFDDQRSLKLRYVYYVPTRGRTNPAGRGPSVPSEFWGVQSFDFGHSRNSKFFGGPLPCPSTPCGPREHVMLRDIRNQLRSDRC